MQEFTQILREATAAVSAQYFHLPVHGGNAVRRERVYCYELYHQMRLRWPEPALCPFFLNGEVDKQQHPYFIDGRFPKPDFLVHVPGTGNNYAAVEVKPRWPKRKPLNKDIETLLRFRELGYERALYLLFGIDPEEAIQRIGHQLAEAERAAIEFWVHPTTEAPALRIA